MAQKAALVCNKSRALTAIPRFFQRSMKRGGETEETCTATAPAVLLLHALLQKRPEDHRFLIA